MINMKNVVNYFFLAAMLFSSCTLVEDIRLDCHVITVDSGPQELTFNVSGDRLDMVFLVLRINDEVVGDNYPMRGVSPEGFYDYTVSWSRVKYDVNDGRNIKVYIDKNDSELPRTTYIGIRSANGGADSVTITQNASTSE